MWRDAAVSEPEAVAQRQLREIERDLEAIRFRLLGVHATLPPAPEEIIAPLEVGEEMVISTHLRVVIETLLADKIEPAIRDLRALAVLPEPP
jgi:hypothetical protein